MVDIPATAEAETNLETDYDASSPEQVNKQRKRAGRNRRARLLVVQALMEQQEIRKWIWEWLEFCSIHCNPVVQGDPHATYFNLGQQNVGKRLLQDVMQFPELYVKMVNEARLNK